MTIDMTNNRVQYDLLTDEEKAALHEHKKAGGVVEHHSNGNAWAKCTPSWVGDHIYRTVPQPKTQDVIAWNTRTPDPRIEALTAKLDDLQDRLDAANKARAHVMRMAVKKQGKIEALTEQLKTVLDREAATTARYDAKTDELEDKLAKAVELLRDAERQLVYLDERRPTGTTPTILARINAIIAEIEGEQP
jgi:hypothetical protein